MKKSISIIITTILIAILGISVVEAKQLTVGDTVIMGNYEQDGNTDNGTEPIEWEVIGVNSNKALLISKYALDCLPYNENSQLLDGIGVTWEKCSLRSWLNVTFLNNSFDEKESLAIIDTELKNNDNPKFDTDGGNNTKDKVFLLSIDEIEEYYGVGSDKWDSSNEKLVCRMTDYSKEKWIVNSSKDNNRSKEESEKTYKELEQTSNGENWSAWWLRTPGGSDNNAMAIGPDGSFNFGAFVWYSSYAIRPSIWIDMNSIN